MEEGKVWTVTRGKVKDIKGDCETVHVLGAVTFNQDIQVQRVSVFGQASFHGTLIADQLDNKGVCFIKKTCEMRHVKNMGHLQLKAGRIINMESSGYLKVEQRLESDCLIVNGAVNGKEIMAKEFHCLLSANSNIQKLIADKITVKRSRGTFSLLKKKLKCERIVGKTLLLSLTEANVVEGEEVFIGPSCRIHTLRYTKNCTINPVSTVQNIIKIGEDS